MQSANTPLEQRAERIQNTNVTSVNHDKRNLNPHAVSLSLSNTLSAQLTQRKVVDENHSQIKYYLSLIDDPLWKKVCRHVEDMMGPLSVVKIWECKLGSFSSERQNIEINCKTEETAQFLTRYAFVILGGLKQYFPQIKKIKVNCERSF